MHGGKDLELFPGQFSKALVPGSDTSPTNEDLSLHAYPHGSAPGCPQSQCGFRRWGGPPDGGFAAQIDVRTGGPDGRFCWTVHVPQFADQWLQAVRQDPAAIFHHRPGRAGFGLPAHPDSRSWYQVEGVPCMTEMRWAWMSVPTHVRQAPVRGCNDHTRTGDER